MDTRSRVWLIASEFVDALFPEGAIDGLRGLSTGLGGERSSSRSGAPLTNRWRSPWGVALRVTMNLFADSNGTTPRRGQSASSTPALSANVRSVPSVGSPTTRHRPSASCSRASLQTAIVVNIAARSGWSGGVIGVSPSLMPPSGRYPVPVTLNRLTAERVSG